MTVTIASNNYYHALNKFVYCTLHEVQYSYNYVIIIVTVLLQLNVIMILC